MSSTKSKEKKKKKKKNEKKKSYDNNVSAQTTLIADVKPAPLYLRKMFVGGLHPYMTKEDLIKYFNQFGQVEKGIIMTDKVTGRSRGFGFIIFSNKETIDKIMSISNCHFLCGKWIECKRAQPKEQCIKMLSENNTYPSLNYNDNLVLNDIITDHSKSLLGDKVKNDMNLFMYQNYIPKDQIKYFLKNANQFSSSSQTQSITSNSPLSTASNRTTTNSVSNTTQLPKHTFQNYFNNCITNMQNYNYFHYKLFDSKGEELTKLKLYKNSNKIRVFPIEMDHSYKNNSNEVPSNEIIYTSIFYPESKGKVSERKEESDNEVDVSSDFVEVSEKEYSEHNSDDCFGPNRQRGKAKLDGSQGDFRPY